MKKEIESLEKDIICWRKLISREAVGLFIATLACWSVPSVYGLRLFSFIVIFSIFLLRIYSKQKDFTPFMDRYINIAKNIVSSENDEKEKKSLLYDLIVSHENYLSISSKNIKPIILPVVCILFYAISLVLVIIAILSDLLPT